MPPTDDRSSTGRDHAPTDGQKAIPIGQAVELLGLSYNALKGRLQRGTLPGYRGPDGWMVFIGPESFPTDTDRPHEPVTRPSPDTNRLGEELAKALEELGAAKDEANWLRGRVEALETALSQEQEARTREGERADVLLRETIQILQRPLIVDEQDKRPWWRRIFRR